jgi:hypothetical protein
MGARNRVGIGLSYRPAARLQRVAESIPGLFKNLKVPSLAGRYHEPIPVWFLVHKDCSKILAQASYTKFEKSSKLSLSVFWLLLIKANEDKKLATVV